jgi:hypothetical protein
MLLMNEFIKVPFLFKNSAWRQCFASHHLKQGIEFG